MPRALLALLIAAAATLVAAALSTLGGPAVATLELSARDALAPPLAPVSPALVVVARDAASEARLGSGAWDRAVLARAVGGVARGGAAAIGLDTPPGRASAPGRGGAASDALLAHAAAAAGNVVFPLPSDPGPALDVPARAVGHTLAVAGADGLVRRVPLVLRRDGAEVFALGVTLAAVAGGEPPGRIVARIPVEADGGATLRWAPDLNVTPFSELWEAIEQGDAERVRRLAEGKTVLFMVDPAPAAHVTPIGPLSRVAVQAELLNAVLTGAWLRSVPPAWAWTATMVLAALAAWLGLARHTSAAVLGVALLAGACVGALTLTPWLGGPVLPVVAPLAAVLAASAGALVWGQVVAARRLRGLESEVGAIRDALVRQESTVEALEEDLEAARAAVARSTGAERDLLQAADALRGQLGEARAQEAQTRAHLQALEGELRAAAPGPAGLADTDLERLRSQCAEVGVVTRDRGVLALFQDLRKAARASLPILISGEPGTGKELFARAAHRLSARAAGPFVAVNMAAIAPELFESELFGHVRGSFTGAVGERKGYFEQAHGGTIFLDEIGELRAEHQGKLLRVLQERTFHRVGGHPPDLGRRAGGGRNEPGPGARRGRGVVPRGPALPAARRRPDPAAAAGAARRRGPARRPLPARGRGRGGPAGLALGERAAGAAAAPVAGQRPRAAALPGPGRRPGRARGAHPGRPAAGAGGPTPGGDCRRRRRGAGIATPARVRHAGDRPLARLGSQHRDPAAEGDGLPGAGRVRR